MKVGVITFHSANNYGATLQTWALQKVLKDYGLDAGVINYHPNIIDRLYDPMMCKQGIRRKIKKLRISMFNRQGLIRYNKFQNFLNNNFNLIGDFKTYDELQKAKLNLDAYIVGSDQVWNPSHTGGFDPAYFLDFAEEGKKRISYAASIGKDFIHTTYKKDFRKSLENFTAISVREKSILAPVKELTTKPVQVVLDPTMLLRKEDYEEIKVKSDVKEPYILVYMIEKNDQVMAFANKISVALGLPIIRRRSAKGKLNELPPFYTADAGEFLGLIESAEYVITNSFHGTVFSILYGKPFVSMLHSDTGSRTEDLLNMLNLQSHILNNKNEFNDFKMFQIENPVQLRKKIDKLQKTSYEFLIKSLGLSDKYDMVKCPTNIKKEHCFGCMACQDICKSNAINMEADKEGFLYPVVDESKCIQCGLCNKVCIRNNVQPILYEEQYPLAYCAYHLDQDVRKVSSSGGIFPALSRYTIEDKKGLVVGVRYNENMTAIFEIADNMEAAKAFRGSKYVKSDFRGIFPKVKELLKDGRFVLYSGLPCECAGLRSYLQKDYANLLVCELLCHAAPSPKVFNQYVDYLSKKYQSKVIDIDFRNKRVGGKPEDSEVVITLENGKTQTEKTSKNIYFQAFINDFITRPVCSNCKYTFDQRIGDITIGDCWGIDKAAPELSDNKGTSMVLVNNNKGREAWNSIESKLKMKESNLKDVFIKNHKKASKDKRQRTAFFQDLDQEPIESLLVKYKK